MGILRRLYEYYQWCAEENSVQIHSSPPFMLYQSRAPDAGLTVAMPQAGLPRPIEPSLTQLSRTVGATSEPIHIVFIEELYPDLSPALQAAGFNRPTRVPLMVCSPATLRMPPDVLGLVFSVVTDSSSIEEVQGSLDVHDLGFDPTYTGHASVDDAEQFRQTLTAARVFVAWLNGVAVAGGMYQAPHAGITRLDGIATVEPYRRRGIAASLSATMTRAAFEAGVMLACLSAATEAAERVYARIGYQRVGTLVTFTAGSTGEASA